MLISGHRARRSSARLGFTPFAPTQMFLCAPKERRAERLGEKPRPRRPFARPSPGRDIRAPAYRTPRRGLAYGRPSAVSQRHPSGSGMRRLATPGRTGLGSSFRLRSARGWTLRLAACPRRRRFCRRVPVRASCCPDMHLGRPPVWSASTQRPKASRPDHAAATRIPLHVA